MRLSAWGTTRLRYEAKLNPPASRARLLSPSTEVSFMAMESLHEDGTVELDVKREIGDVARSYSAFQTDDVVVAKVTPCFENGKAALAPDMDYGVAFGTTEITVLRASAGMFPKFLYYVVTEDRFRQMGIAAMTGAGGLRRIPDRFVRDYAFRLPPLDEQRQIAEYLDRETGKIDELITKQEQLVATLTERRLAVISRAVTQGMRRDAVMRPSGIDWLGDVPTAWAVKRIKDSVRFAKNGVWGEEPDGGADDIWCVRVADFDRPTLSISQLNKTIRNVRTSERNGRVLKRGDLILEKSGGGEKSPVGFVAIYDYDEPAVCSNFVARVQLEPDQDARYWLYLHAAAYGTRLSQRSIKQTSGIQNLDQSSYFNEKVAFPPLDEQVSIVQYLDEMLTQIDSVVSKTQESVALLHERRAALISAAVTGKIDVRGL